MTPAEPGRRGCPADAVALGGALGTRTGRWALGLTLALGLVIPVAVTVVLPPAERTFGALVAPTQTLMSVPLPFVGALLTARLGRARPPAPLVPVLGTATAVAVAVAGVGLGVCAAATGLAPSIAAGGRWTSASALVLGSVGVQVVAQLVGTGLGLLLRPAVLAGLATVVLPLSLWLVLGAVAPLVPAQAWLTPFPSASRALAADLDGAAAVRWLVVVLLWVVVPNGLGAVRLGRARGAARPRT